MGQRWVVLSLVLLAVALTKDHDPIRFLHPKSRVVLSHPRGVEIPVQVWIERHPEHRLLQLEWARAGETPQRHAQTVDGDHAKVFPAERWLTIRLTPGEWVITALACSSHQEALCTRVHDRASMTVRVCGGDEECGDSR